MNSRELEAKSEVVTLINRIQDFGKELNKTYNEIKPIIVYRENAHPIVAPRVSNIILEQYKKRLEVLEIMLNELKNSRYVMQDNPECLELTLLADQMLQKLEKILKLSKESVILQEQSNQNMEEMRSKRVNPSSFFKKAAVIAGMGLVAVSVMRVLGG